MSRKASWPPKVYERGGRDVMRLRLPGGVVRDISLGATGSPESRAEYARIVAEVAAHGGALPPEASTDLTVVELCVAYTDHNTHTDRRVSLHRLKRALQPVTSIYGHTRARDFGPRALRTIQQWYIDQDLCRAYSNQLSGCVRRMFRWAVAEELLPPSVAEALSALPKVRKARGAPRPGQAREAPKVRPADPNAVEATLPFMPPQPADLCRLLMVTGMRPAEGCAVRPADIDRAWKVVDGMPIWLYRLDEHKSDWRGHLKWVPLGPRAQEVLAPYLEGRDPEVYCFSPEEAARWWFAEAGRKYPERRKRRRPKGRYTAESLSRCVARARERAGAADWSPGMLRHLVATVIETERGREDARVVLGHSTPTTTARYAEQVERAARVMAAMG